MIELSKMTNDELWKLDMELTQELHRRYFVGNIIENYDTKDIVAKCLDIPVSALADDVIEAKK